tara:strand:- start:18 stop:233 length:216 start_codon:yes stop_codon:yes gene_type:complete
MKTELKKINKLIELFRDKFDNMENTFWDRSESWQDSDKGQEFQEKMDAIETAIDDLEMIENDLKEAFNLLD